MRDKTNDIIVYDIKSILLSMLRINLPLLESENVHQLLQQNAKMANLHLERLGAGKKKEAYKNLLTWS